MSKALDEYMDWKMATSTFGHPGLSEEKEVDVVDEDWLAGVSCNPDAPEECESCS